MGDVQFATPGQRGLNLHGHYWHLGLDAHAEFYGSLTCRFQGEVGVQGASDIATLRRTLTTPWPVGDAWTHKSAWWNRTDVIDAAFGPVEDLEAFVAASQWLQAHGLRAIVEAARSRAP